MVPQTTTIETSTKRTLLLRDGLTFVILTLSTLTLYGVTTFLFHSFESHRSTLGKDYAARGRQAIQQGRPAEAITALRAALNYAPDDQAYQLLLAQALADAGRTDEATAYYQAFWDARPGDGNINLQLARLERKKPSPREAINFYRASIFGAWQGDAITRRREVRLELADYLTQQHELAAARVELLIAAGNAPHDPALYVLLGDKLQATTDIGDAMTFYEKAIEADAHNEEALERAGRLAYATADYSKAHRLLMRAAQRNSGTAQQALETLAQKSDRLDDLNLSRELPASERYRHLLIASAIARSRLKTCTMPPSPALTTLQDGWKNASNPQTRKSLATDASTQDAMTRLVFDTELKTAQSCGTPEGDDALLLLLARSEHHVN